MQSLEFSSMPIYEYRCSACKHELEAIQKFSDAPLVTCPQCSKETLTKLVSAAGFHLKGNGWYQTDFRNSGSKPATKAKADDSKGSDATAGGTSGSTDAKSGTAEAKPEAKAAPKTDSPAGSGSSAAT
jgi:putative FmdB family regulatory protein